MAGRVGNMAIRRLGVEKDRNRTPEICKFAKVKLGVSPLGAPTPSPSPGADLVAFSGPPALAGRPEKPFPK